MRSSTLSLLPLSGVRLQHVEEAYSGHVAPLGPSAWRVQDLDAVCIFSALAIVLVLSGLPPLLLVAGHVSLGLRCCAGLGAVRFE